MASLWAFVLRVAQHLKTLGVYILSAPCQSFVEGTMCLTKSSRLLALGDHG